MTLKTCTLTDLDISRSASILLTRYGTEAVFVASRQADKLLEQGDVQGCLAWVRIAKAITELEPKTAGKSDLVH